MATETEAPPAVVTGSGRIRPHQVVIAIGIFAGIVVTWGSWLADQIFNTHEHSHIHREVFGDIPDAWVVVFYTVTSILIVYGAYNFSLRVRNWERGAPDN